jgi:hypothetical protein
MKNTWAWIFGIVAGLLIIGLLLVGRSSRQAYRLARGAIEQRTELRQDRIFMAAQMASKAVDLALLRSGDLPANQAKAAEIKQKIEEISYELILITDARGDVAVEKLDKTIELFNAALQAVEDASKEAESPAVKSVLDRIYGMLEATQEQLVQTILSVKK